MGLRPKRRDAGFYKLDNAGNSGFRAIRLDKIEVTLATDRRKASIRFTTVADEPPSGPPPASLPLRLSGGWFGGHLIHPIDFAEFIQKLWIAIVQTDDLAKPGAVPPFVFYDFAPNFDFPKQQRRGANKIQIFFPRSDRIPT